MTTVYVCEMNGERMMQKPAKVDGFQQQLAEEIVAPRDA